MSQLLVSLLLLVAAEQPGGRTDFCEWMSGSAGIAESPLFAGSQKAAAAGDFNEAFEDFLAVTSALAQEAEVLFFSGTDEDLERVNSFMDRFARGDKPILFSRRDQWALHASVTAWGAWLACRAGRSQDGMRLLKGAWRDWGDATLLTDAAFLNLALEPAEKANDFVQERPAAPREMVCKGLFLCLSQGDKKEGLHWLDVAAQQTLDDRSRELLQRVRKSCVQ